MSETSTDGSVGSLSTELEKAAQLLRSKGMGHAAAALLAPTEAAVAAEEAPVNGTAHAEVKKGKRKYTKRAAAASTEEKVTKKAKKPAKAAAAAAPKAKVAKAAKAKVAKAAKSKRKAISGQSGPALKLTFEDLNKKEKLLLGQFELKGDRETLTIEELADTFKAAAHSAKKANSWVRNSLRRPMRASLVEKPTPGSYRITQAGRKVMAK